ncbi:MAG: hypothetical protein GWN58_33145 [Anaerolineae bacterium]|nr:DUF3450 domain-containing protein [Thermoplasmata archaeon]NIV34122.1 hypothetical protein [Anaerolineae bacterium]NIY05973.1 hypothetical protein [Thermoplasmata archaeon]
MDGRPVKGVFVFTSINEMIEAVGWWRPSELKGVEVVEIRYDGKESQHRLENGTLIDPTKAKIVKRHPWSKFESKVQFAEVTAGKDPKIDKLKEQIEDMDRTIDQLKRRQEALTGPEVDPNTAEAIRNSIQRRIDAVNEDKQEIQTQIQEMIMQKCGRPGKGKGKK